MAEPSNTVLQAFAPGIYPRSEELVQATRDLDRGRTSQEAVDEQVERDLGELVSVQQAAGLDLLADGMLRWQDVFRPIVEAADGLEKGALTRFLDTNTFYRAPSAAEAAPKLSQPLNGGYVAPLPGPRLVTLPSPFALAHGTGVAPAELAEGILKPQIDALDAELVVLEEPFLARAENGGLNELGAALEKLGGGPKLALWVTFGSADTLFEQGLADLPVDAIGVDFYATKAGFGARGLRQDAARRSARRAQLGSRGAVRDRCIRRAASRARRRGDRARPERGPSVRFRSSRAREAGAARPGEDGGAA